MTAEHNNLITYPQKGIRRAQITNRLNLLHFRGEPLLVIIRHKEYDFSLTLKALSEICHGDKLFARWSEPKEVPRNLHQYITEKIIIPGISTTLELSAENVWLEAGQFQVTIPEFLEATSSRKTCRQIGTADIEARLTQHSVNFGGTLIDYSPDGIRLEVKVIGPQSFYWFHSDQDITLTLSRDNRLLFSGQVKTLRNEGDLDKRTVVVIPTETCVPRYSKREKRTKRFALCPAPDISFVHPLTGAQITLSVRNIATLGVAVEEMTNHSLLLPGLILENIELSVFGSPFLTFTGQVVYRSSSDSETLTCGIAILDIGVHDHFRLIGLVHRTEDENAFVRINHDPEKFFEFLFDTGFLYPSKYEEVHANREKFLEAYRKLYLNPNEIARCFVFIEQGQIYGHVSALKIYRHAWLNHHHAALPRQRSGLKVLRQISDFHNDSFVLNPLQMRYVVGIWRPNNDFPAKFFGRFQKNLKKPDLCSIDTFTYMHVSLDNCRQWDDLQGPWEVAKATRQDICEFEGFYQQRSGGLLTKAFDLTPDTFDDKSVEQEYASSGLKRIRHLYAVRYGLDLKALVEVQDSDTGLNLSELTNAVYLYILDETMITPKVLEFIQCMITVKTQKETATVMIYPHTYVKRYGIDATKEYNVWILNLNTEGSDAYMKHLARWCK